MAEDTAVVVCDVRETVRTDKGLSAQNCQLVPIWRVEFCGVHMNVCPYHRTLICEELVDKRVPYSLTALDEVNGNGQPGS